jgi:hypothetical protein
MMRRAHKVDGLGKKNSMSRIPIYRRGAKSLKRSLKMEITGGTSFLSNLKSSKRGLMIRDHLKIPY